MSQRVPDNRCSAQTENQLREGESSTRGGRLEDRDRGLSEITGYILLLGIVAAAVAITAATGFAAIDAVEEQSIEEQSIQKMDVVRSGVADVQYDHREQFDDVWATEEHGTMTLEVNGDSDTRTEIDMGALLYESESGLYASQAGGTWTETDSGSRMIHEPALSHTNQVEGDTEVWSLTVPPLQIQERSETSAANGVHVDYEMADGSIEDALIDKYDGDETLRTVTITIEDNPYQDAWARFLEDELPTDREDSEVNQTDGVVTATAPLGEGLPGPVEPERYDIERTDPPGSVVSTAEEIDLTNAEVDSFDSAARPYEAHAEEERRHGVIEATGDVSLSGGDGDDQMVVRGDVLAGGTISGQEHIDPGEGVSQWDNYTEPAPVTDEVSAILAEIEEFQDEVDNDTTAAIDDGEFDGSGTLESGVYYLEEGEIDDDLEIDVSDGDVVIAVDGDLTIDSDVDVHTGDSRTNDVRWYVGGDVTVDDDQTVSVQDDRAPQHWIFGGNETTTSIGDSASFTGAIYTPGSEIDLDSGSQNDRTQVYGGLVGDVEAATNAHFAYDRALDRDPRAVNDAAIGGPNHPFDAEVTLAGAEFGWSPQISSWLDFFDPFDIFDPGERDSFEVDLPDAAFEHVDDPDGELEYFQTATGTTSATETRDRSINGSTADGVLSSEDVTDEVELDVQAGETITVRATNEATRLSLSEDGLFSGDEIADGEGRLETTVDETTTLELGVATDEERDYALAVEKTQQYEEINFEATEYDEFGVELTSDDAAFAAELREGDEVMTDTGVLFSGNAGWTADAGETINESYNVYRSDTSFDGGEGTIRIVNVEGDEPIDYDLTLEQTEVDSSIFDIGGDPAWFQQLPVETELQFRNATETETVQPWPETEVENVSDPPAAHEDDINHPAADYPKTYAVENLSPGTTFAPSVTWRDDLCSGMDSYAGSWRTPDSGSYEGETLFEMGCSTTDDSLFGLFDDPEYELNRELDGLEYVDGGLEAESDGDRIKILEDGDQVPDADPFEAQHGLQEMLGEKIVYNESTDTYHVDLDDNEFVILFELAPESVLDGEPTWENALETGSDAPDFNDVVMQFEITEVHDDVTRFEDPDGHYQHTIDIDDGVLTAEDA